METLAATGRQAGARTGALVFVGFMGAGKSSAARAVASHLGVDALDSDRELEAELGEPLERFFDRAGERAFREREEKVVTALLARSDAQVVALGGGALASEAVRSALRPHTVVHLEVALDDAWHRASGRGRPLARDRDRFDGLHAERAATYAAAADATLPAGGRDLPLRALASLLALSEADSGALKLVWAEAASGDYPVFFGRGLVERGFFYPDVARRFLVTDENVARHHSVRADARATIAPGEGQKTLTSADALLRQMAREGLTREDLVVALGGGVVGDLAGFCGAVYQRGVRVVQVPTSLVAQVDSAFGGKTGVDLPEAKNYVGAYHQPTAALVDPATLATLPDAELAAGYSEVVKTALIAGGDLWATVRRGDAPDDAVILGCLRTKLGVVAADERDGGRRQVLNLGHTVAHALEAATGYSRYRHGEAVAIGLMCALRLSGRESLRSEVAELLSGRGLPLTFSGCSTDEVVALVARDKKRRGAGVPFVLVERPGEVTHGHEVGEQDLRAAIEELREA